MTPNTPETPEMIDDLLSVDEAVQSNESPTTHEGNMVFETPSAPTGDTEDDRRVSMPATLLETLLEQLKTLDEAQLQESDLRDEWLQAVTNARQLLNHEKSSPQDNVNDPKRRWDKRVAYTDENGKQIDITTKPRAVSTNTLSTASVVMLINEAESTGITLSIPLYASGFHVTVAPPTLADFVSMSSLARQAQYDAFSATWGMRFTNSIATKTEVFVRSILRHVVSTSLEMTGPKEDQLLKAIHPYDIPHLLAGYAATFLPDGFEYERGCMANPGTCSQVAKGRLNVRDMMLVDKTALSSAQLTHLAKTAAKSHSHDSLRTYRNGFNRVERVAITPHVDATIGDINLMDYFSATSETIALVESFVREMGPASESTRSAEITRFIESTDILKHVHWIKALHVKRNGTEVLLSQPEHIRSALQALASNEKAAEQLDKAVNDYHNRHIFSHVGVSGYRCESCGGYNSGDISQRLFNLIPVEALRFFSLLLAYQMRQENIV